VRRAEVASLDARAREAERRGGALAVKTVVPAEDELAGPGVGVREADDGVRRRRPEPERGRPAAGVCEVAATDSRNPARSRAV
jgi:hypothetical protein